MKKILSIFIFIHFVFEANAQQAVMYSQFMLNNYGLNPAVAGTGVDWNVLFGRRTQWRGFPYAPQTNFLSVVKDFGKKGIRRYWHGAGAYVEQDRFGAFDTRVVYGSYAIHLKLSGKHYMSFGLAAGAKTVTLTDNLYNPNDPALALRSAKLLLYPDIIPGVYLYSGKFSTGISVRNIYKNTLQQKSKKIGTPTKLPQVVYFTVSRKFRAPNYDYVFIPAIQAQSTFTSFPTVQFNCIMLYRKVLGIGLSYRMHDAVSAMLQIHLYKFVVGFAFDYTISKFRSSNANSTEIMMGFTPDGSEDFQGRSRVAHCPKFDM